MSGTVVTGSGRTRIAIAVRESSNRVFGAVAADLLMAELEAVGPHIEGGVHNPDVAELGGLSFVRVELESCSSENLFVLSNLALGRGVFDVQADGSLRPLDYSPLEFFDSDLVTIQRYVGKTNEQFTHLLLNLALAESRAAHTRAAAGESVRLLDPVAGRGSTLNRGLTYGFDVAGVELEYQSVDQYRQFLAGYLKDHRVKHKVTTERIRKGAHSGARAFEVAIRPASETAGQHVRMVCAPTDTAAGLFSSKRFDVIAGDLPYGLAHRAKAQEAERSPEGLIAASLAGWVSLLAAGGSLGLSWNVRTLPRDVLSELLASAGLTVVDHPRSFEHRVDRQIVRDVIVARKG